MKRNLVIYIAIITLMFGLTVQFSQAQKLTLDDWKNAKNARGCESIPYYSEREKCEDKHDEVNDNCKTEETSCQKLLETKSLRENITGIKQKIEGLKKEKDQLNDQRSRAGTEDEKNEIDKKIKKVEDELYEKEKKVLYEMEKSLETDLSDISNRIYKAEKCLRARKEMYELFENVIRKADSESESEEIRTIAKQLVDYWTEENKKHKKAIEDAEINIKYCRDCREGIYE